MSGIRVSVDRDLCTGHGQCALVAPELFELDEDDIACVLIPEPGPELVAKAERAEAICPEAAIALKRA